MAMSGFICHDDYLSKTAKLSDEEVGRLFRALMRYHATGEEEDIQGRESIAFDFIREDIDRTDQAYKTKCEKNRENRLSAVDNNRQRSSTFVNVPAQKEKEKEKENNKESVREKEPLKRFTPPTPEEVAEYCRERGNKVDPERFVNFYASKGWKVGNQAMKDWKAAVRTWENEDRQKGQKTPKTMPSHEYTQRDYSEPSESMDDVLNSLAGVGA